MHAPGSTLRAPVQSRRAQVEGSQVETDARVLVGQAEADVLSAGGVLRGVAATHRGELQCRSNGRGAGAGREIHHRRHRQLRLRHTDKRAHRRGVRVSQGGEEALEAELQNHSLEDVTNVHAEAVQAIGRAARRSERYLVFYGRRVANDQPEGEQWHDQARLHGPAD